MAGLRAGLYFGSQGSEIYMQGAIGRVALRSKKQLAELRQSFGSVKIESAEL